MGADSKIQWTHHTFNPWIGCQRVSPGCVNCYAEAYDKRVGGVPVSQRSQTLCDPGNEPLHRRPELRWGPNAPRTRTSESYWRQPLKWNEAAKKAGERHRVFCASLADVFEERPELRPWRQQLFGLIKQTPHLDWLLLTKRPENMNEHLPWSLALSKPWPNVWLGTTIEDQQRANERIPYLVATPAAVRFLSCEPLLEAVDLGEWLDEDRNGFACDIDWVIIGGESGPRARPFDVWWARSLVNQCRDAGRGDPRPFVKQLGAKPTGWCKNRLLDDDADHEADFCDLYESGESGQTCGDRCHFLTNRHGGDPSEWPEDLRIREFPTGAA